MVRKFRELMIYIIAMLLYFIWPYLTQFIINGIPNNKIVYVIMHEDEDQFGNIKPNLLKSAQYTD